MMTYIVVGSLFLLLLMLLTRKSLLPKTQQQDSALKQRALLSVNEQLTYSRLKEILPDHTVFVHVSYDALLTTKFSRTRSKYRDLVADFVVVDALQQVVAIVGLDDPLSLKRSQKFQFQDALLESAGYRVIRYEEVPNHNQLREDFCKDTYTLHIQSHTGDRKSYTYDMATQARKLRVTG